MHVGDSNTYPVIRPHERRIGEIHAAERLQRLAVFHGGEVEPFAIGGGDSGTGFADVDGAGVADGGVAEAGVGGDGFG